MPSKLLHKLENIQITSKTSAEPSYSDLVNIVTFMFVTFCKHAYQRTIKLILCLIFRTDHCMVDFVKPKLLGTRKEFTNRFVNPINNGQCSDSRSREVKLMKRRAHILHETLAGCVQVGSEIFYVLTHGENVFKQYCVFCPISCIIFCLYILVLVSLLCPINFEVNCVNNCYLISAKIQFVYI